jgi:hypothetical protein
LFGFWPVRRKVQVTLIITRDMVYEEEEEEEEEEERYRY